MLAASRFLGPARSRSVCPPKRPALVPPPQNARGQGRGLVAPKSCRVAGVSCSWASCVSAPESAAAGGGPTPLGGMKVPWGAAASLVSRTLSLGDAASISRFPCGVLARPRQTSWHHLPALGLWPHPRAITTLPPTCSSSGTTTTGSAPDAPAGGATAPRSPGHQESGPDAGLPASPPTAASQVPASSGPPAAFPLSGYSASSQPTSPLASEFSAHAFPQEGPYPGLLGTLGGGSSSGARLASNRGRNMRTMATTADFGLSSGSSANPSDVFLLPPVFVERTFYKSKAALTLKPIKPLFRRVSTATGTTGYALDKEGSLLLSFAHATGTRLYGWTQKQMFSLSVEEMGQLSMLAPGESLELLHDPHKNSPNEGRVTKTLRFEPSVDKTTGASAIFVIFTVRDDSIGLDENFSVPLTLSDFAVMRNVMNFIIPYCLGLHAFIHPASISRSMVQDEQFNRRQQVRDDQTNRRQLIQDTRWQG